MPRKPPLSHPVLASLAAVVALTAAPGYGQETCRVREVWRDELKSAMDKHGDYDIVATTNRGRFTSELILRLAAAARERDPDGDPLFITAEDWFFAYVGAADIDAADAPEPAVLGLRHGQRVLIDYAHDRVVREVKEGPQPLYAVNVKVWWPDGPQVPKKFSFTDTASIPKLKVTSHREIRYRLLQFDDMIVLDEMKGISGRPISGVLGALFNIIGEGSLKESRLTVSEDGLQVLRGRSKKIFSISATVTVYPDGQGQKGIPEGREDLEEIEARLKQPLKIDYFPPRC